MHAYVDYFGAIAMWRHGVLQSTRWRCGILHASFLRRRFSEGAAARTDEIAGAAATSGMNGSRLTGGAPRARLFFPAGGSAQCSAGAISGAPGSAGADLATDTGSTACTDARARMRAGGRCRQARTSADRLA